MKCFFFLFFLYSWKTIGHTIIHCCNNPRHVHKATLLFYKLEVFWFLRGLSSSLKMSSGAHNSEHNIPRVYQGYIKGLLHTGVLSIQCVRLPLKAQFFFCQLITLVSTKIIYNICIYGNGEHFGMQYMVKDILYMNLIVFLRALFFPFFFNCLTI